LFLKVSINEGEEPIVVPEEKGKVESGKHGFTVSPPEKGKRTSR